jgi:hypothetical protein
VQVPNYETAFVVRIEGWGITAQERELVEREVADLLIRAVRKHRGAQISVQYTPLSSKPDQIDESEARDFVEWVNAWHPETIEWYRDRYTYDEYDDGE